MPGVVQNCGQTELRARPLLQSEAIAIRPGHRIPNEAILTVSSWPWPWQQARGVGPGLAFGCGGHMAGPKEDLWQC
jgi:hypothetical protein